MTRKCSLSVFSSHRRKRTCKFSGKRAFTWTLSILMVLGREHFFDIYIGGSRAELGKHRDIRYLVG